RWSDRRDGGDDRGVRPGGAGRPEAADAAMGGPADGAGDRSWHRLLRRCFPQRRASPYDDCVPGTQEEGTAMSTVAVIGAGTMGHALALVYALGGHRVRLTDTNAQTLA